VRSTPTLVALIGVNALAWLWAILAFSHQPALLGAALLAYVFGVRHAFDADHIAAIDNVVRSLARQGRRSHLVGLFFALGHSTVVILACVAVAFAASAAKARLQALQADGGAIGSLVSASFLLAIGSVNLIALRQTWRVFGAARRGEVPVGQDLDAVLESHGVVSRLFRPLFRMAARPWHMFPIGLLFGLGFDTATEVGLLGLSAAEAARSMSPTTLLVFPALFTAGMTLLDTTDSVVMTRVYDWAFVHPLRKLWFNLTITATSVTAAIVIAGLELIGLWADRFCKSAMCARIGAGVESANVIGLGLVGLFILCWAVSVVLYRRKGYDALAPRLTDRS
jgi:high-affinity nickel-transport protein